MTKGNNVEQNKNITDALREENTTLAKRNSFLFQEKERLTTELERLQNRFINIELDVERAIKVAEAHDTPVIDLVIDIESRRIIRIAGRNWSV